MKNKMKNQITRTALSAAIALSVVACGPSGTGGLAGIGGSGYVSSGSVTGFGSVFVNGVEFETDSATFDVDGDSGTQDDLAIGMIVKVSGSINDDGISGTATSISFDDELQGPVSGIQVFGTYDVKRSFSVLGTTVILDSGSTTFDVSGDITPPVPAFGFDTITDDYNVEISGFFDSSGALQATRVELKEITFVDNVSIVEAKGLIKNVSGTTFDLGDDVESPSVDASGAAIEDLPNGLVNDQLVEVKGTYDSVSNTITATKVEAEDESFEDSDEFEIEGLISGYVNKDTIFKIADLSVDASNAEFEPASLSLADDVRVEAEGAIVNGVLIASEIELEGGDIKVHAPVTSVNEAANTFEMSPVFGQPVITVTVTTDTQLQDDVSPKIEPFNLTNLVAGDFVEVQGFENDNGGITATEVEVKDLNDVEVQGYATAATGDATGGSMTVLGIKFDFTPGTTDFENENDVNMKVPEIDTLITTIKAQTTPQLVKIQDDDVGDGIGDGVGDGIADEIDIE